MTEATRVNLKAAAVSGRAIGLGDVLVAFSASRDNAEAPAADTVREVIGLFFANPPASLTAAERKALRDLIGAGRYRGTWAAGAFAVDELTVHNARLYRCRAARTSGDTDDPATDTTGWESLTPARASVTDTTLFKGAWSAGVFGVADIVRHAGAFYICEAPRDADDTDNPAVDTASWTQIDALGGGGATPTILSFDVDGERLVPIGSIAGRTYLYDVAVSQHGLAASARIVGFAGQDDTGVTPAAAEVLAAVSDLVHGRGTLTIPAGVALANAGDAYTLRLEVYGAGQTPGTDAATAWHDHLLVAQGAGDRVTLGYVDDDETAADVDPTARVIATRSRAAGEWTVAGIPDDGQYYRLVWVVPAGAEQPTRWVQSSLDITPSIEAAVARTISGVDYQIYLLAAANAVNSSINGSVIEVS